MACGLFVIHLPRKVFKLFLPVFLFFIEKVQEKGEREAKQSWEKAGRTDFPIARRGRSPQQINQFKYHFFF